MNTLIFLDQKTPHVIPTGIVRAKSAAFVREMVMKIRSDADMWGMLEDLEKEILKLTYLISANGLAIRRITIAIDQFRIG